jgi:hypothetical protein
MLFILSTGRSGTTTVARWLTAVEGITCLHEPEPAFIREASTYRYGELDGAVITAVLRETRPFTPPLYAESNQTLALLVPLLVEIWPEARFVWLLRNGRDVVASAMQKQWYTGYSAAYDRYEDATPTQQAWIDGRLRGDRLGDMRAADWEALPRFGKCCWYWHAVNRLIEADLASAGVEPFVLKLETLPDQALDLLAWLGITARSPEIPQANTAKRPPYHWSNWSAGERALFEQFCGAQMDGWYADWRDENGRWQDIPYATPPVRNRVRFSVEAARHWLRNRLT